MGLDEDQASLANARSLRKKTSGQNAVQNELDRDRGEDEAHQPAGDLEGDHAEYLGTDSNGPEDQEC